MVRSFWLAVASSRPRHSIAIAEGCLTAKVESVVLLHDESGSDRADQNAVVVAFLIKEATQPARKTEP